MGATGYIYLIKAGEFYKIGKAKDVKRRLAQFSLPFKINLIHTILVSDMSAGESALHRHFADFRVKGEWFILSDDDVQQICRTTDLDSLLEWARPRPVQIRKEALEIAVRLRFRVGRLMQERDISEAELAKRADVARNTVRSLQRGVNTRADLGVLERIAAALGVRPLELFEETENGSGQLLAALTGA